MSANKKKACGCKRTVVYRNHKLNSNVITSEREIPMWAVNLKQRNRQIC
jgi:hypothetical protein